MKHFTKICFPLGVLVPLLAKILIQGADASLSIAFAASCALYGYYIFLKERRVSAIHSEKLRRLEVELSDMKSYLSAFKIDKGIRRVGQ